MEALKTTVQDALGEIGTLCKKLKSFQREHKSSIKDLQSVRSTLEKLQNVRL